MSGVDRLRWKHLSVYWLSFQNQKPAVTTNIGTPAGINVIVKRDPSRQGSGVLVLWRNTQMVVKEEQGSPGAFHWPSGDRAQEAAAKCGALRR